MGTKQPQFSLDSLRSQFKVMRECTVCKAELDIESIRTIESSLGSHILHVTCVACENSLIFLVGSTQFGIGLVGLVSDLNFDDSVKFRHKQPIDDDRLIEYYQVLTETKHLHQFFS